MLTIIPLAFSISILYTAVVPKYCVKVIVAAVVVTGLMLAACKVIQGTIPVEYLLLIQEMYIQMNYFVMLLHLL